MDKNVKMKKVKYESAHNWKINWLKQTEQRFFLQQVVSSQRVTLKFRNLIKLVSIKIAVLR
jgi:hypothetical protein